MSDNAQPRRYAPLPIGPDGRLALLASLTSCSVSLAAIRSPIITVKVGPDLEKFRVHKDLLCHYSSYFRGALGGAFLEATTHEITLDDDDPTCFEVFADLICNGGQPEAHKQIPSMSDSRNDDPSDVSEVASRLSRLGDLWIFGNKRGIPRLQNWALDEYHRYTLRVRRLCSRPVRDAYARTVVGSKWRSYLVELHATTGHEDVVRMNDWAGKQEFLTVLSVKLMQMRGDATCEANVTAYAKLDLCQFHIHQNLDCKGREV